MAVLIDANVVLRYLLDGDAASNTLSWRWVAGLHTPGKTYLARADNIARYTRGRSRARGRLAERAELQLIVLVRAGHEERALALAPEARVIGIKAE